MQWLGGCPFEVIQTHYVPGYLGKNVSAAIVISFGDGSFAEVKWICIELQRLLALQFSMLESVIWLFDEKRTREIRFYNEIL